MYIIVAQTVYIILHTKIMMEYGIFGILEITVYHQSPYGGGNPYISPMIACYETHLMAFVNRETFQVVAMTDKYLLTFPIACQVIDTASESSNPDTPLAVLVYTIYIIVTQTIYIILPVLIARQLIAHLALGFRFYKPLSLGGNPKVGFAILIHKIDIPFQRCAHTGYGSRIGQVSAFGMVLVIDT